MSFVDERLAALKSAIESELTTLRLDNAELNACVGDIEALIPADCRNSRPDRLASVRAAVGFLAQRLAMVTDHGSLTGATGTGQQSAASSRLVLSTAPPGTGAWAWEQMQRGPEVWVRRECWALDERIHLEGGQVYDTRGPCAVNPSHSNMQYATDWELCAAPGRKEAKQAEFHALATNAPETPLTAPSAKDGPTEEQFRVLYRHYIETSADDLPDADKRRAWQFTRAIWQAAREGMVPRGELTETQDELRVCKSVRDSAERRVGELEAKHDEACLAVQKQEVLLAKTRNQVRGLLRGESVDGDPSDPFLREVEAKCLERDAAQKRVGELERDATQLVAARDAEVQRHGEAEQRCYDTAAERDELRVELKSTSAELERVKAELGTWNVWGGTHSLMGLTPAAARDSIASDLTELVAANDALAQIENLCGSDQELEPYEVVGLVRKTLSKPQAFALPLTEAQREELAKVLYPIVYPLDSHMRGLHQTSEALRTQVYQAVDAIAPRIARLGAPLRELSNEEAVTAVAAGALGGGATLQSLCGHIARAILAAAQGGDVGQEQRDTISKPPRGRKLTDGEQGLLVGLCDAYRKTPSGDSWRAILACVESLLAPQELETPRKHTPFSELFHKLWGQAHGKEYDKALWVQAHEMLFAPQDGVRVALGVCTVDANTEWRAPGDRCFFGCKYLDDTVTQALSASPGDKFEFSVVARRVE